MAFMDKLGQMAGKVGSLAGDTFDYGKAKGKIVLERGKIKDGYEALGNYIYNTLKNGGAPDGSRMKDYYDEIDSHFETISILEKEAKESGSDISDAFRGDDIGRSVTEDTQNGDVE